MNVTSHYGEIKNGKLILSHPELMKESIQQFKDCNVEIIIKRITDKHSEKQTAYYFGYLINEYREGYYDMTGERISKEQAHEELKGHHNIESTKELNTIEFTEYLDNCVRFMGEWFGRTLQQPDKNARISSI